MSRVSFAKPNSVGSAPSAPHSTPVVPLTPAPTVDQPVAQPVALAIESSTSVDETLAAAGTAVVCVSKDTAVVTGAEAPAVPAPAFFDDESLDVGDLVLPRLAIVQKVGELSNVFAPGTVLLNGQLVLQAAPQGSALSKEIRLLIVGFNPTIFVEKVEGGLRGNTFKTEQEVVNAGGTLDYNEAKARKIPKYDRSATAMLVIEAPAVVDVNSFPIEIEGKRYAFALYTMKGTAYTNAAKHFKSSRKIGQLREGYRFGWWTFQSQLKKFGDNYAYIPVVDQLSYET